MRLLDTKTSPKEDSVGEMNQYQVLYFQENVQEV